MIMHKLDETVPGSYQPTPEFLELLGPFMEEVTKSGVMLAGEGLRPSTDNAARVKVTDKKTTITDGPFTETKELIAGFVLVDVRDKAEAVEIARRFADVFAQTGLDVEIDVRRVTEFEDINAG
ncbi:YciI family protein [Micromonospora mirobrigensis]|nr:YciI family protein [Micromonospora mirobrigensis]